MYPKFVSRCYIFLLVFSVYLISFINYPWLYTTIPRTTPLEAPDKTDVARKLTEGRKTILFWNLWFGSPWNESFGPTDAEGLKLEGCPNWKCDFTYDRSYSNIADAIMFPAGLFNMKDIPKGPRPHFQRWVWLEVEAPTEPGGLKTAKTLRNHKMSHLVNWTMTYHSESDIVAFYGHFLSLGATVRPLRPNLMSDHSEAMRRYMAAMERGDTLETVMGPSWRSFVKRP
ncbi:hypothetical protein OTU49_003433, partial [Cherax quadricarinatus]